MLSTTISHPNQANRTANPYCIASMLLLREVRRMQSFVVWCVFGLVNHLNINLTVCFQALWHVHMYVYDTRCNNQQFAAVARNNLDKRATVFFLCMNRDGENIWSGCVVLFHCGNEFLLIWNYSEIKSALNFKFVLLRSRISNSNIYVYLCTYNI